MRKSTTVRGNASENKKTLQLLFAVLLSSLVLNIFLKKLGAIAEASFFHVSCLGAVPFAGTFTQHFTCRSVRTLSFHPEGIC